MTTNGDRKNGKKVKQEGPWLASESSNAQTLSARLLHVPVVDDGLDALFKSTVPNLTPTVMKIATSVTGDIVDTSKKRKASDGQSPSRPPKRRKSEGTGTLDSHAVSLANITGDGVSNGAEGRQTQHRDARGNGERPLHIPSVAPNGHGLSTTQQQSSLSDHEEVESDGEADSASDEDAESDVETSATDGDDDKLPVHESLIKEPKTRTKKRLSRDEPKEQRDARTIFVGNLPIDVAKAKNLKTQLMRHLTSFVPGSEIESMRFRSVAFQTPTQNIAENVPDEKPSSTGTTRRQARAAKWRENAADPTAGKVYLTEPEKKKVAFIKGDFHAEVDSINAYAVLAYPDDKSVIGDGSSVQLQPDEAARLVVEKANGSKFLDRTLRLDHVGDAASGWTGGRDPKATVFVGNLDFTAKEEDLRAFFEGFMTTERGDATDGAPWVSNVRLVRDKSTQLGKGFAYVLFKDRACVDEVLVVDASKLKFAKRTLRVARCKSAPPTKSTASGARSAQSSDAVRKGLRPAATPVSIPKGDPRLGERLAGMDKESRKAAKSADEARLARRLAKKKAKAAGGRGGDEGGTKRKERVRSKQHFVNGAKGKGTKPRVKSDRALSKMNVKK